ncbi:hypothetical protein [Nocardia thailandica]
MYLRIETSRTTTPESEDGSGKIPPVATSSAPRTQGGGRGKRLVAAGLAALAVTTLGLISATQANAAAGGFNPTKDRWKDCDGATYCTLYYSVQRSEALFNDTQSAAWGAARVAETLSPLIAAGVQKDQGTLDGIESAANQAVHDGGCLQFQWRKDGKGRGVWSSTTHPGYCWREIPSSYVDDSGQKWTYDEGLRGYVPNY